jgi:predicted aspartyl protease
LITGQINQAGSPVLKITVYGNKGEVTIDGILDAGFDGFICLPIAVAVPLGLELINVTDSELADGTIVQDELVFMGKVLWDDVVVDVDILLTGSVDTLIGTAILMNSDVRMNFRTREVSIE